jgi:hypothetical protein
MMLNLVLAVLWVVVAGAIFLSGDERLFIRLGTAHFSSGWLALGLALWNLVRWWSVRSYRRARQAEQEALARRSRRHAAEERREPAEPDPNFNFTDPPPG